MGKRKFMDRKEFEDAVVAAVKAKISHEPWFKGICTDRLKSYREHQFDDAVEALTDDTVYWDAPNSGF